MKDCKMVILAPVIYVVVTLVLCFGMSYLINGFSPLKPLFAKEIKVNGVCHIHIDDKFSIYFEPPEYGNTKCFLYVDGVKSKVYAYIEVFESKYDLIHYMLSDYHGNIKDETTFNHYVPCQ